ncbi:MAG: tetratricopeptide repeat protein [Deltaproteobacteria bacterium]|nr:tetratricopeptide repeat protein [Deltaproteobacteria bacterium]
MKNSIIVLTLCFFLSGCSVNYDRIISKSTKSIEKNPNNAKAYIERGDAYESKSSGAETKLKKDYYDKAMADYTMAIDIDHQNAKAYDKRGWVHYINDNYDNAIADYTTAIEIDPDSGKAKRGLAMTFEERGLAYAKKWDLDNAIADCTKAIEIYPFKSAFVCRARAYYLKEDYDRALADCNMAIKKCRYSDCKSKYFLFRAKIWEKKGDDERAAQDRENAFNLTPSSRR